MRSRAPCRTMGRVLLLYLLGRAPVVLVLTLVVALYLTVLELRELRPRFRWWAWWVSLVLLTHFVGYLLLRGYVVFHRYREARA